MEESHSLGDNLRDARKRAEMTQRDAAKAMGYARIATISDHENNKIPLGDDIVEAYAKIYGTTAMALRYGVVTGSGATIGGNQSAGTGDAGPELKPALFDRVSEHVTWLMRALVSESLIANAARRMQGVATRWSSLPDEDYDELRALAEIDEVWAVVLVLIGRPASVKVQVPLGSLKREPTWKLPPRRAAHEYDVSSLEDVMGRSDPDEISGVEAEKRLKKGKPGKAG